MVPAILHKQDTSFKSYCWTRLNVPVAFSTTGILTFWRENAECFSLTLTLWSVAAKVFGQKVLDLFYPASKHTWKPGFIPCSFSIWNFCFVASQGREKQALPEGTSVTLRFNLSLISPGFLDMSAHDCGPKLRAVFWMLELSRMDVDLPVLLSSPCTAHGCKPELRCVSQKSSLRHFSWSRTGTSAWDIISLKAEIQEQKSWMKWKGGYGGLKCFILLPRAIKNVSLSCTSTQLKVNAL